MQKFLFSSLILATIFMFAACNKHLKPSANVTNKSKVFTGYTKLDVSNAFTVDITFSDNTEEIIVEANENLHPYIVVEKNSNSLVIKLKDHTTVSGNPTLKVHITTKKIIDFYASGASHFILKNKLTSTSDNVTVDLSGASSFTGEVESNNFNTNLTGASIVTILNHLIANNLNLELSGASVLTANLEVGAITANSSGASSLNFSGAANSLTITATGASTTQSYDLIIHNLTANLSGASNLNLTIIQQIDAILSGASILNYKGDATIHSQDLSGSSQLNKIN